MKVVVTGATGFIGSRLCARLTDAGHEVTALSRDGARAQTTLGPRVRSLTWASGSSGNASAASASASDKAAASADGEEWKQAVAEADAVVNLAGASVADTRWTPEFKQEMRASRVDTTRALVDVIRAGVRRPSVLLNSSAIGYYGDRQDETLTEASSQGHDFLAEVCADWEEAAKPAEALGVRVARLRIGVVLGQGGALAKMLRPLPLPVNPYKLGLGGRIGSGRQWLSWIHIDDVIELFQWAMTNTDAQGAINVTAPNPVTNGDFTHALGRLYHRPTLLPVPAFGLRIMLGEFAETILTGQKVLPAAAETNGYHFKFPTLEPALRSLILS